MANEMYDMIFKRKSFHLFRNIGSEKLTEAELQGIHDAYEKFVPIDSSIKTAIRIMPAKEKILGRGAEYAILIYSEKKDNYLMNAGYIGQQLDLYLVSQNIGSLWYGIGKPDEKDLDGMTFVIMILIAKVDSETKFRKDMFKSKRKPIDEIWFGEKIPGVTDIARFAPSACNSQPWKVYAETRLTEKHLTEKHLTVCRYKKQGVRGIMPALMVGYYNQIDIGIFLYFLELCMTHEGLVFTRELLIDNGGDQEETTVAKYNWCLSI